MPKEFLPGFLYMKSDELNQEIAFSLKSGWVYCEDKGPDGKLVNYSPEEIVIFNAGGNGKKITQAVHNVKKVFEGRIVQYGGLEPDRKRKSDAGKEFDGTADNSGSGGKIPEAAGNSPCFRPGELEIY
jgi:hypothetical protein